MMNYEDFFSGCLDNFKRQGNYRTFAKVQRIAGQFPKANLEGAREPITVWCSNDYLGMGQHPDVLKAMENALYTYGAGSGGTRNISGTTALHDLLERNVADFHKKESGLIFTSGYVANETVLSTLGRCLPDCVIFSDAWNHASMIEGIRHSGAEKHIFAHNDVNDLEEKLKNVDICRPKIIAFESVYSMDGDVGPIAAICALAKKYNAITYLDEVHGIGLYGPTGAGIAEQENLSDQVDIIQGTFGKALGVIGGYITSSKNLIDFVRSKANGFIFTTSIPPVLAAGILESLKIVRSSHERRILHQKQVAYLKKQLQDKKLPFYNSQSHIVPIVIGDSFKCKEASRILLEEHNIYIQPINYPTVPRGTERLRLSPSPLHTNEMIDELVCALDSVLSQLSLRKVA
jgi:5-aminolevulinate synthase